MTEPKTEAPSLQAMIDANKFILAARIAELFQSSQTSTTEVVDDIERLILLLIEKRTGA